MAKMFYSLEEAAQKLGATEDQVKQMAGSGKLQQFRDRDKLMFKRDQVDALAGKSATEIYGELREFASGKEDANGIMAAHAMGFSDAQLKSIASYFASVR
jgi:excisionase family DNA binding protein